MMLVELEAQLKALSLTYQVEKSFKMSRARLYVDRYIVGVALYEVSPATVRDLLAFISCPQDAVPLLMADLARANRIGFGFESNGKKTTKKVYLEFWDDITKAIALETQPEQQRRPRCIHKGYKWQVGDMKVNETIYTYHPLLSIHGIADRLKPIYADTSGCLSHLVALSLLDYGSQKIDQNDAFYYLEAQDKTSKRCSFDLNFYKADIKMVQLSSLLKPLVQHFDIDQGAFDMFYQGIAGKDLGHLSGGLDKEGQDFMTIYYAR